MLRSILLSEPIICLPCKAYDRRHVEEYLTVKNVAVGCLRKRSSRYVLENKQQRRLSLFRDRRFSQASPHSFSGNSNAAEPGLYSADSHNFERNHFWRFFNVEVMADDDPGKDDISIHSLLVQTLISRIGCRESALPVDAIRIVKKSFDARKASNLKFVYTVDVSEPQLLSAMKASGIPRSKLTKASPQSIQRIPAAPIAPRHLPGSFSLRQRQKVVVVGSGPAGLFCALVLAEEGFSVELIERGQGVEVRGRDIGAMVVRKQLDPNSNFCYGEGGAGTWSDGKLTTRIGKNSEDVRSVLSTLVRFGAPDRILIDGKPHLGTDRLVKILRNFRSHLLSLGVRIRFGHQVDRLEVRDGRAVGVVVSRVPSRWQPAPPDSLSSAVVPADAVVLAIGHSARELYATLHEQGVLMTAKDFAVGFRVEHPQRLINEIQYGKWASLAEKGSGKLPVADYSLAVNVGPDPRGCFSFCMCPGGQVVPTSTIESELCVNGMSFSKRSSPWANSALVTAVTSSDFEHYSGSHGPLAGIQFQRAMEREAAIRGGGGFMAPVQRVADFINGSLSAEPLPTSSYRMGVRSSRLDEIYPSQITQVLKAALLKFDQQLPGFICKEGLLHGVETRTSSPVRMDRDRATFESVSLRGLFPVGEGAGYAGGIVSAAVDGMKAGVAIHKLMSTHT